MYGLTIFSELGKGLTELTKLAEKFKMLPEEQLNKPLTPENCRIESMSLRENKNRENLDQVVRNKLDGCEREEKVEQELEEKYPCPPNEIIREAYLRDENGNIVRDPITGTARRVDFVVVRDGEVVDSVEVTSQTAPKEEQIAKESRIRENGGIYVRTEDGSLAKYPTNVTTRIERKD